MLAYCAASLLHHVHNATFLHEYPNMPVWLTSAGVYAAWAGESAIGIAGYVLLRRGYRVFGLTLIVLYGAFGLGGLMHYDLAPLARHSLAMNATIWIEAAAAILLLATVVFHPRAAKA